MHEEDGGNTSQAMEESLPEPGKPVGILKGSPEEDRLAEERRYDRESYNRSYNLMEVADKVIAYYRSVGIRPCDVPHIHGIIRASFGY